MPRSILLGRPWPREGEPLFLREDTEAVLALAEEEAAACPLCGLPKSVCSDPLNQWVFEAHDRRCFVTQTIKQRQHGAETDGVREHATAYSAQVRDGRHIAHRDLDALELHVTGRG